MRIGIIATELPPAVGGMQEHAFHTASELARGNAVTVFTRTNPGIGDTPFPVRGVLGRDLAAAISHLRAFPADVWLGLSAAHAMLVHWVAAPVVLYCHGNDLLRGAMVPRGGEAGAGTPPELGESFGLVRHFVCNSRATAGILAERYGVGAARCTVVPPGVDARFFVERPDRKPGGAFELLTVGRLTAAARRKNVDGVLRALTRLPPDFPIRYRIVGDGDDRPRLERLVAELGLSEKVDFAGALPNDALPEAYARADLMVLASTVAEDDIEGFGMVYLEANAAGTPVLAAASGGALDAVRPGRTGLLLPSPDPEAIAEAILSVARGDIVFEAQACRDFAAAHRWPAVSARLERVVARAAGAP